MKRWKAIAILGAMASVLLLAGWQRVGYYIPQVLTLKSLTIGSGPAMTQAPVMTWGTSWDFTVSASPFVGYFGTFTPSAGETAVGIEVHAQTSPVGCSPNALIQLYDVTGAAVVAGASTSISSYFSPKTTISASLTAGHQYTIQVVGGTGCTTNPANLEASVQYRMQ